MKQYKIKVPCAGYAKGDIVDMNPADAAAYGPDYLEEVSDVPSPEQNAITADADNKAEETISAESTETDITPDAPKAEETKVTEETTEVNTGDAVPEGEAAIDYDKVPYPELKDMATAKGIEFKHNIKKEDLIELLKK